VVKNIVLKFQNIWSRPMKPNRHNTRPVVKSKIKHSQPSMLPYLVYKCQNDLFKSFSLAKNHM